MASATLLLPSRTRLAGGALPDDVARALGRAEQQQAAAGMQAQLERQFQLVPDGPWPVAALTRQRDAGDAQGALWLRVDPASIVPDMQGARLMAHGDALQLEARDAAELLPALRPLFGDAGLLLDAPHPSRWYLRLPAGSPLPVFTDPDIALGDDVFDHLPLGAEGRRWRALFTEAQIVLHQHPWNQQRAADGKRAVNALWFWGGGQSPSAVSTAFAQVRSRDSLLQSLALAAGIADDGQQDVDALVDLRHLRSLPQLGAEAIRPLLAALQRGELKQLVLDFEDGCQFALDKGQRWKFWKKPLQLHAG